MDGVPVYLASLSRRNTYTGRFVPTSRWSAADRREGTAILDAVLAGIGDPAKQREFRMNVTLCRHRAITDAEWVALPAWFHEREATWLAGGPIEILWETIPGSLSTKPCAAPRKEYLAVDPALWVPLDCGVCPSCRARARIEQGGG